MPNRVIKESIKTSEEIDKLSWFEEIVFYRLMVTVDDYGCYDGRAIVLKNELFPTKDCITRKNVEDAIEKLESVKLLVRYTVKDRPYIYLPTFGNHQRLRNRHRKYPEPPELTDAYKSFDGQLSDICQSNVRQMSDVCPSEIELELEEEYINSNSNKHSNNTKTISNNSKKNKKVFIPPTIEEVEEYCRSRNNGVDPQKFYDYYSTGNWEAFKGKESYSWKQKMVAVWERNNNDQPRVVGGKTTSNGFVRILREGAAND